MRIAIIIFGCLVSLCTSCGPPPPPENLAALETPEASTTLGQSAFCKPKADGSYPDTPPVVTHGEAEDFVWAEGGGCVHRPIEDVWETLRDQERMVWREIDRSSYTEEPVLGEGVTHIYRVHYEVDKLFTVEWDMLWTHTVEDGAQEAPTRLLVHYEKVSGTTYMPLWRGTILVESLSDGVTGVSLRDEISAAQTDAEDAAGTITDLVKKLRTQPP